MFRDTMEEMEELDRYHSMMWLVEAAYGDYAFFRRETSTVWWR